ncbi:hypothetical protein DBV15_08980 [Temnothorax longispinosus]|uniref:Uncharacterized protein n=1 Tax=Temnothorax longispinosus TaxID=300112 RepID=A0A4S2JGJ6_9HYME|nr:hypothetical protein DBV15_08980 [Temnothorax longispinosus]
MGWDRPQDLAAEGDHDSKAPLCRFDNSFREDSYALEMKFPVLGRESIAACSFDVTNTIRKTEDNSRLKANLKMVIPLRAGKFGNTRTVIVCKSSLMIRRFYTTFQWLACGLIHRSGSPVYQEIHAPSMRYWRYARIFRSLDAQYCTGGYEALPGFAIGRQIFSKDQRARALAKVNKAKQANEYQKMRGDSPCRCPAPPGCRRRPPVGEISGVQGESMQQSGIASRHGPAEQELEKETEGERKHLIRSEF